MSEHLCAQCGKKKNVFYELVSPQIRVSEDGQVTDIPEHMETTTWCPVCDTPQQPKHTGWLGEPYALRAHYDTIWIEPEGDTIDGIRISGTHAYQPLTYAQALELLAWLKQEEPTLKRLEQEQTIEHGSHLC